MTKAQAGSRNRHTKYPHRLGRHESDLALYTGNKVQFLSFQDLGPWVEAVVEQKPRCVGLPRTSRPSVRDR